MSELEDKISEILGDSEQMAKITKLAQSLMGGEGTQSSSPAGAADTGGDSAGAAGGFDPAGLGIDAETLGRISHLLSSGSTQNREEQALLSAMRPYLSEKRRGKMDRAMKLAKLARIARLAIGEMEDDGHA